MDFYDTPNALPQNLKSFASIATNGLTSVKVKEMHYDRIALEDLNQEMKLDANNPVYFDGNVINDTKIKVITNGLANMQVELIDGKKYLTLSSTPKPASANVIQ